MKTAVKLWIGIGILILFSPLGILLPDYFRSKEAWGEWGVEAVKGLVGYVPQGLKKISGLWSAPLPDYAFRGQESAGGSSAIFGYIFSALIGILAVVSLVFLIVKFMGKKNNS